MDTNTKAMFEKLMAEQQRSTDNLNHQGGVFLLSDPSDVNELLRSFQGRMPEVGSTQNVNQQSQEKFNDRHDCSFDEYHARLQTIEEELKQYACTIAKDMNFLAQEFVSLGHALEHLADEHKNVEAKWQKETDEREQRLLELMQSILDKEKDQTQRSSWLAKLLGSNPKK